MLPLVTDFHSKPTSRGGSTKLSGNGVYVFEVVDKTAD